MGSTMECGDDVAGQRAVERHAALEPLALDGVLNSAVQRVLAGQIEMHIAKPIDYCAKGLDECAMIFHWVQVRDVQQAPWRAVGRPRSG